MKKTISIILILILALSLGACGKEKSQEKAKTHQGKAKEKVVFENPNYIDYVDEEDIVRDSSQLGDEYSKYYDKYLEYTAPNGKAILLVAADKVSDEQLLKAYNVLDFYLTDTEMYSKTDIANAMADKGAVLNLPNGADGDGNTPDKALLGQPLYQMELPTAGSKWYQENDYEHRDASYEEIFHMVHDYGIGTTENAGALPELSEKIKSGMDEALPKKKKDWGKKGIWGLDSKDWLLELSKEASLEQEYIVGGIDSYYGLWEAYSEGDRGMWGIYVPKTRKDVEEKDSIAYEIITDFLGPQLTYMERIAPEFQGTFKISLDPEQPYTFKSQYLQRVRLTGDQNSNIEGNDWDNIFLGNRGNNRLDGKEGLDVVQFSGSSSEYEITKTQDGVLVKDTKDRDGEDTLIDIEVLRFTDQDMEVSSIE